MKNKGHDYSTLLIWAAALVTVVRYAAAFVVSDSGQIDPKFDGVMEIAMLFSGLGMGILDVIGGTYLFTGWQKKMPKNGDAWSFKFKVLTFFAIGLIVNGILILWPFTISRIADISMFDVLGGDKYNPLLVIWSAVVNVAPYLLIGGVAVGNQIVTTNEQTNSSPNGSQVSKKPANDSRTYASLSKSDKYYIVNNDSKLAASEFGVTSRAVQKWRLKVQEEISQGKL